MRINGDTTYKKEQRERTHGREGTPKAGRPSLKQTREFPDRHKLRGDQSTEGSGSEATPPPPRLFWLGAVQLVLRHSGNQSRDDQPHQENAGHPEEHLGHDLVLAMLLAAHGWRRTAITKVEGGSKQAKGKGTDSKRHVKASVSKAKRCEGPRVTFWLRSLSRWSRRQFLPGVLFGATPAIKGYHLISADACLAHWANLAVGPCLQPLMQARPAE